MAALSVGSGERRHRCYLRVGSWMIEGPPPRIKPGSSPCSLVRVQQTPASQQTTKFGGFESASACFKTPRSPFLEMGSLTYFVCRRRLFCPIAHISWELPKEEKLEVFLVEGSLLFGAAGVLRGTLQGSGSPERSIDKMLYYYIL